MAKVTISEDGVTKEPAHITIDGVRRPVELVELSFGCSEHDAPMCSLLRLLDTGEELHLPGSITSIRKNE